MRIVGKPGVAIPRVGAKFIPIVVVFAGPVIKGLRKALVTTRM